MEQGTDKAGPEDREIGMSASGRSAAEEAVGHLQESIRAGKHWYLALLEAMELWTAPDEIYKGQHYQYLIAEEAFDWLLLAERLCDALDGLVPQEEEEQLLFEAKAPMELSASEFKRLMGSAKYSALLNYWYGVEVEGALLGAVEEDIHKERMAVGFTKRRDVGDEACRRVYGASRKELLKAFRQEKDYQDSRALSVTELKEFTYWLFKHRVKGNDPARVASDTKRGLEQLQSVARRRPITSPVPYEDPDKIIDLTARLF